MPKIYTKTGDAGETSLLRGRVKKDCLEIKTLGDVDELNAGVGILISKLKKSDYKNVAEKLAQIQRDLFVIGANVAAWDIEIEHLPRLEEKNVVMMEDWIDEMEMDLAPLHNFILPGGNEMAAKCFWVRAVCRRAESNFITLSEKYQKSDPLIKKYFNRLSDLLFVLARFLNSKIGEKEMIWKGRE